MKTPASFTVPPLTNTLCDRSGVADTGIWERKGDVYTCDFDRAAGELRVNARAASAGDCGCDVDGDDCDGSDIPARM